MTAIIFSFIGISRCQKVNSFTQPKCCSDSLLSWALKPQPWEHVLRQATYQSIIHHLQFTGTLDGRLDRDQALWKQFLEADFLEEKDTPVNVAEDNITGVLEIVHENEPKTSFKFHKTNKSAYECTQCYSENKSVLALWQVRKAEHPHTLRINVRLPRINGNTIEDMYEYNGKYGLKKINTDQLQYSELKNHNSHRFSFPQDKKNIERSDFYFQNPNQGFNGMINPPPFLYNSPVVVPAKAENGWIISPPPRKAHPGVIVNTATRHSKGVIFDTSSLPYTASDGPNGFRHVIHSLPSLSPPKQQLRGFLPSVGPVRAPSPYKTEYAYDPRFVLYYNRQPNADTHDTTPVTRKFKPSTEFVRYSEVDPFYHPEDETILHTTPTDIHHFQKVTPKVPFIGEQNDQYYKVNSTPTSINEQFPTNLPSTTSSQKTSFQIIVGDMNSNIRTTTVTSKPINRNPTVQIPQTKPKVAKSRPQVRDKPKLLENKITTKYFGDKIKAKGQRNRNVSTSTPIIVKSIPSTLEVYKKERNQYKDELKETFTTNYNTNKLQNNTSNTNQPQQRNKNTSFKEILERNKLKSKIIKNIKDSTTISNAKDITSTDLEYETTTEFWEMQTDNKRNTFQSTLSTTLNPVTVSDIITTENSTTNRNTYTENDPDSTIYDYYYNEETTETNEKTNTGITNSSDNVLFTLLTESFTTDKSRDVSSTTSSTTESPPTQSTDGETQESNVHNTQYRLLTFPGDSVSIVANTISKTYSYRTAGGKEGKLQTKEHNVDRLQRSDIFIDHGKIVYN